MAGLCCATVVATLAASIVASCADPPPDGPPGTNNATNNTPPSDVLILSPKSGAVVSGTVKVAVEVRNLGEVRGVEFYVDEDRVDSDIFPPFELSWDTLAYPDGPITLGAQAAGTGNRTGSASIGVTIDNTPPAIELVSPEAESMLFFEDGGMDLVLSVTDTLGVSDVTVMVNGLRVNAVEGTAGTYGYHVEWAQISILPNELPRSVIVSVTALDDIMHESEQIYHLTVNTRLAWQFSTLGEVWAGPLFDHDDNIYIGSQDGFVYAFDPGGVVHGQWDTGGTIAFESTFDRDGNIIVPSGNTVQSWSPTGVRRWSFDFGHAVNAPVISTNGQRVLVGTYAPGLSALDVSTGTPMWTFSTPQPVLSSPAVDAFGSAYFGCHDGNLYAVDDAGQELWHFPTGDQVWSSPTIAANSDVLFGSHDGFFYRVNRYGTKQWDFPVNGQIWGGASEASDGTIYVGSTIRGLHAFSPSGTELWFERVGGISQSTPALGADGTIYIGTTLGELRAYTPDGDLRFAFASNQTVHGSAGISPDGSLVVFGSADRNVYGLRSGAEQDQGCGSPETVVVNGVRVMVYEASRADATGSDEGIRTDRVCSGPGVVPWVRVTWDEARNACMTAGMDLCPEAIWQAACNGPASADFPYGTAYVAGQCRGSRDPQYGCDVGGTCEAAPTGSLPTCTSASGLFDASGNVREWVLQGEECCRYVRGGSFRDDGDDLRCSNTIPDTHQIPSGSRLADVGFRCCAAQ